MSATLEDLKKTFAFAVSADVLAKLDAECQAVCKPISDKRGTIEFRTKIAGVLARRTAAIAFQRAGA